MAKLEVKVLRLTLGEYIEKLYSGEIAMAPVPEPYPLGSFRDKVELNAREWQQLIDETDYLCIECATDLSSVGGTRSSARVRRAKAHLETLNELATKPNGIEVMAFIPLIEATQSALLIAKGSLATHNAQPRKFVSYDLETGEPLNKPDYTNVNYAEIIASMGILFPATTTPNRAQRRKLKGMH